MTHALRPLALLPLLLWSCFGRLVAVQGAEQLAGMTAKMRQFVSDGEASGVVALVAHGGRVVHLEAVGYADLENKHPMEKDTMFCIASMTKPITATAVMILQDEGKLSIDRPVSQYLPEFRSVELANGPPRREITIRDLLTHTSGVVGSQQNQGTLERTVQQIAERELGFEPGTRWEYGPGLTVCGRIIEVISGVPYHEFLDKRIFHPLGMVDTTFFPSQQQRRRIARLYQPGPDAKSIQPATHWLSELSDSRTANPSGGLFSTAADMAKFYQMVLDGGQLDGTRIVSVRAVTQMTTVQTGELRTGFTPGNGWGLGWCVVREPQGITGTLSPGTFGHGGALGTQGWVDPKRQMIFVLMIQRTGFGNSDGSEVRRALQELAVREISKGADATDPS